MEMPAMPNFNRHKDGTAPGSVDSSQAALAATQMVILFSFECLTQFESQA